MKKTVYSTNPKPFIKNGSFVRVHEDENISSWGVVVNDRIVYQDGGFDMVESVLPEKVVPEIKDGRAWIESYIDAVVNVPYGFDDLNLEVPDWQYKESNPMPKLETGMFVFVDFCSDKSLGGLGVVVGEDIVYQSGGFDKVSSFDKNNGKNHNGRSQITDVIYGDHIHNFNYANNVRNSNGTSMSDDRFTIWKAQD